MQDYLFGPKSNLTLLMTTEDDTDLACFTTMSRLIVRQRTKDRSGRDKVVENEIRTISMTVWGRVTGRQGEMLRVRPLSRQERRCLGRHAMLYAIREFGTGTKVVFAERPKADRS